MSAESMRVVEEIQAALGTENIVAALADEEVGVRVRETLDRLAEPDFEVTMVASESAGGGTFEDRGADGFTRLWEDWSEPFAALGIERRLSRVDFYLDQEMAMRAAGIAPNSGG